MYSYYYYNEEIVAYLMSVPTEKDSLHGKVNSVLGRVKGQIGLMNLGQTWINVLIPHVLSKPVRVAYGCVTSDEWEMVKDTSPISRFKLAVPFVGKDMPSTSSEFAQPDVAIGFTTLAFHYQGLRVEDVRETLRDAQKRVETESGPVNERPTMAVYKRWVEEGGGVVRTPAELMNDSLKQGHEVNAPPLHQLQLENTKQLATMHELLMSSPGLIAFYLEETFPKLMTFQEKKLSASGEDIGGGVLFDTVLGFSGTPNDLLPYGMCPKGCDFETGCEGEILHVPIYIYIYIYMYI